MPKTFSDSERAHIRSRLIEEAKLCLARYGVRKTTVDELVRRVNIPKGTFYLFYSSKEHLFFDAFLDFNNAVQSRFLSELEGLNRAPDPETLTELLFGLYKSVEDSFIFSLLSGGELDLLIRRLPEELVSAHLRQDDFSAEKLLSRLPGFAPEKARLYSAALRAVFLTSTYRREIGPEVFDDVLKLMLRGVALQMVENGADLPARPQ